MVTLAFAVALGAAVLAACGGAGGEATASPSAASDPVVLLVDGSPIHRSAVDAVRAEFRLGGTSDSEARAEKEVVRRELVRREAAAAGRRRRPDRSRLPPLGHGRPARERAGADFPLARVPMTDAQLRSGLADGVLREALQDSKYKGLAATAAAARDYYDGHRGLFRQTASAHLWTIQVAAERIAESALGRLRDGRPFAEVARQFTTDPEAKAAGGDMGVVALSSLPAPLRKAVETTRGGEVSAPVQGPGGWYLVKATDRTSGGIQPFADVRQAILSELTRRKRFAALDAWLDAARDKATVTRP